MYIFDNHKYSTHTINYTMTIRNLHNTIIMEIGEIKQKTNKKREKFTKINPNIISGTRKIKKPLLEHYYGIYRMFPLSYQHNYHMNYIHIPGVIERNIRSKSI